MAIFGGSFDPPHQAHLLLLSELQSAYGFQKIWIVPSKFPPGKTPVAPYSKRLEWTEKVFSSVENVVVSNMEEQSSQTIFAKDIFYQVQIEKPEYEHYWILGEDQWDQLPYWKDVTSYINQLGWVVLPRENHKHGKNYGILSRRISDTSCYYYWANVNSLPEVSSTRLRELAAEDSFLSSDRPERSWLPKLIAEDVCQFYSENQTKEMRDSE